MTTPEIVWTRLNPDQADAWHVGRQWLLSYRSRTKNGLPRGWYLHATVGAFEGHGRWVGSKYATAQEKATTLMLSPEGRDMAAVVDREAGVTP